MVEARLEAGAPRFLGRIGLHTLAAVTAQGSVPHGSEDVALHGVALLQATRAAELALIEVVVTQAGIVGLTVRENFGAIAGQAGVTGHLCIGGTARIGAQAGTVSDAGAGKDVVGSPAQPVRETFHGAASLRRLARKPSTPNAARPE